jgi:hypothetical protein
MKARNASLKIKIQEKYDAYTTSKIQQAAHVHGTTGLPALCTLLQFSKG